MGRKRAVFAAVVKTMSMTAIVVGTVLMAQGRSLTVNVSFRDRSAMGSGTLLVVRLEREGNTGWGWNGTGNGNGSGWNGSGGSGNGSNGGSGSGWNGGSMGSGNSADPQSGQNGGQNWNNGQNGQNGNNGQGWNNGQGMGWNDWGNMNVLSEVRVMLNGESSPFRVTLPYSYDTDTSTSGYVVRAMLLQNGRMVMGSQPRTVRLGRGTSRTYTLSLSDMAAWNGNGDTGWNGNRGRNNGGRDNANWSMGDLRGTTWEVSEVDGRAVNWSERMPTITFDPNGTDIRGFSGVNGYAASYTGDAQNIRLTMGTRTMMAGTDGQNEVENRLYRVLPTVSRVTRSGDGLVMWAGDRAVIRLRRVMS